jgi:RNA polymerase primary sigma factor
MSTTRSIRVTLPAPSVAALKLRAAAVLDREIPCIAFRQLKNPLFVAEHRQVARQTVQNARRSAPREVTALSVGEGWSLPELLTPEQERSLFIALNATRLEAQQLRDGLNPRRPARKRLEQIEALIAESEQFRQHLCEANVRLVISVAGKLADPLVSFEDLFSEGLMILLKTIDGFNVSKGFRFSTYATNSLQRHFFRLKKRAIRKRQFGAPIADEVLHTASDWSEGVSLTPDDPTKLTRKLMRAASRVLDSREQRILELRFGLDGSEHTLREIAAVLRVSKERVRQVLVRAVGKLQEVATNLRMEWTPREVAAPVRLGV